MNPAEMVSSDEQQLLLQLARNAIQTTVQKGRKLPMVESLSPLLREKRGVFVTLWMEGELRGCIGFPFPVKPLAEAVQEAAVSAALQDPRFPPVRMEELSRVEIEISVLTPPKLTEPSQIQLGVHGLIARRGNRSGLLLPQVAMEYHWDKETFLQQTCVKAGLAPDDWREKAEISSFEAQVFSENDLKRKAK
ncbi:MAG TPA: AmmeMemoRadiSam system protein A [bacterium]